MGWTSPVELENSHIKVAKYEDAVRQSIWMILGTAKGERVMRPDFGCEIHDKVFLRIVQEQWVKLLVMFVML